MVVTLAPSTCQTKTVQYLVALPVTCTTQAPHCDVSHPTWVPVSRRFSRRYCTRRVRGSTSAVTALPFTVSATADMASSSKSGQKASFFAPKGSADGGLGQNRAVPGNFCRHKYLLWQPSKNAIIETKRDFPRLANPPTVSEGRLRSLCTSRSLARRLPDQRSVPVRHPTAVS